MWSVKHPLVREEFETKTERLLEQNPNQIIIWDIPLLIEGKIHKIVDKVIVVYVDKEEQIKRLMKRNNFTEEEALKRIKSVMSSNEKKKYANFLINNNYDLTYTEEQINKIIKALQ